MIATPMDLATAWPFVAPMTLSNQSSARALASASAVRLPRPRADRDRPAGAAPPHDRARRG